MCLRVLRVLRGSYSCFLSSFVCFACFAVPLSCKLFCFTRWNHYRRNRSVFVETAVERKLRLPGRARNAGYGDSWRRTDLHRNIRERAWWCIRDTRLCKCFCSTSRMFADCGLGTYFRLIVCQRILSCMAYKSLVESCMPGTMLLFDRRVSGIWRTA